MTDFVALTAVAVLCVADLNPGYAHRQTLHPQNIGNRKGAIYG
jgi:hypothetical protein